MGLFSFDGLGLEKDMTDAERLAQIERKLDEVAIYLKEDRDRLDKHETTEDKWKIALDDRIKPLEDFLRRVDYPVRIVGWAVVLTFGTIISTLAVDGILWLKGHWHG